MNASAITKRQAVRQGFKRPPQKEEDGTCWWCGAALQGRQRRYCSEEHRWIYGTQYYWPAVRFRILMRDGYRCVRCDGTEKLEVDHIIPIAHGGDEFDPDNCRTLCHRCHVVVTREQFPPKPKPPVLSRAEKMMAEGQLALELPECPTP